LEEFIGIDIEADIMKSGLISKRNKTLTEAAKTRKDRMKKERRPN
jgi:hypothetical protein